MSGRTTGWAYKQVKTGDPIAKTILVALADNADDDGRCYPSQKKLAIKTEYSISTVKRKLKFLEEFGIIQVTRKRVGKHKTRNFYRLRIEKSFDLTKMSDIEIDEVEGVTLTPSNLSTSGGHENTGSPDREKPEGVTLTPSTEKPAEGVTQTPLKVADRHLQNLKGSQVTPLKGSVVNPELPLNLQNTTTTNNSSGDDDFEFPPQSTIKMDSIWDPNRYIFDSLAFKFGIPRFFFDDTLFYFRIHHNGTTKRQAAFEKSLTAWVVKDWKKFGQAPQAEASAKPITSDWWPSPDVLDVLFRDGIPTDEASKLVPEFRIYWQDHGGARASFGSLFIRFCYWQRDNGQLPGAMGSAVVASKLDKLSDTSWAQ